MELTLAADSLPFGSVVLGSRTTKRLGLTNTGDVGAKFAWDSAALGAHFTIFPQGGLLGQWEGGGGHEGGMKAAAAWCCWPEA